jgi:topoisomerase IA-like protein
VKEGIFSHLQGGVYCSEIETSERIFVLTLNRASALIVEGNKQNFLLRLHLVAITKESV